MRTYRIRLYRSLTVTAQNRAAIGLLALATLGLPLAAQDVAQCQVMHKHGDLGETACWTKLSQSTNPALRAEGLWGLKDFDSANDAFRDAVKSRDKDANLRVRWGKLYLEHGIRKGPILDTASDLFKEALAIDKNNAQAMLGLAVVAEEGFEGEATKYAEKALEADPKLYEARELMARVALEDNNEKKATEEANKAIAISGEALDAMAILATIDWMNDKPAKPPVGEIMTTSPWMDKIAKVNPRYGEAFEIAGHFFVINRRYVEGIKYFRKALEVEPRLLTAKNQLAINLMRMGQEDEAFKVMSEVWDANFRSLETQNTLTLLDSNLKKFDTTKTATTIIKTRKNETALILPYLQAEMDKINATYEKKYKFKLNVPVQLEAYPDHEDFAVRTMGMPGLGALGVTFNTVVAIDSPTAADAQRKPGSFHWASTLWHEMSHVYVLTMTNSRTPRWFTEGLAVYEETAIYPDWGDRLDHPSIQAIKEKKLLPIADLDRGYIHPNYPQQVIVSYFQGGRVITYIVQKFGYDTVLNMIKDYANNMDTPAVIEKELHMKAEEFDKQFIPWVEAQTKTAVDGFDDWAKRLKALNKLVETKDWSAVIKEGTAIRDIYAEYVEAGSAYEALAAAYLAQGDKPKAIAELKRYSDIGGRQPGTLRQLATLQKEAGDERAAATTLDRINWIYLRDDKGHLMLGDIDMDLNNPAGAVREYRAVVAMKPVDAAGAHFKLAKALAATKNNAEAMDEVLNSLEIAPGFKDAQKLLLELNSKK